MHNEFLELMVVCVVKFSIEVYDKAKRAVATITVIARTVEGAAREVAPAVSASVVKTCWKPRFEEL